MTALTEETTPPVVAWGRRIAEEPEAMRKNMEQILRRATGAAETKS
jgi:hypothetical protein